MFVERFCHSFILTRGRQTFAKICIYSNSQSHTLVSSWKFLSRYICWIYFSHFLRASIAYLNLACSCLKRILGNSVTACAWNASYSHFKDFLRWATQSYQQNVVSIALFTSQKSPRLPWQVLESVHRTAREISHEPKHIWRLNQRETTSHLSEACLYPYYSLMMPAWGLLQRKVAPKNTYNAMTLATVKSMNLLKKIRRPA